MTTTSPEQAYKVLHQVVIREAAILALYELAFELDKRAVAWATDADGDDLFWYSEQTIVNLLVKICSKFFNDNETLQEFLTDSVWEAMDANCDMPTPAQAAKGAYLRMEKGN